MTTVDHLWRHFTPAGAGRHRDRARGGCYIWDSEGKRYLDALSALYCVNIGYGPWPEMAEAAKRQVEELPSSRTGSASQARAGARGQVTELLPIDVGRIFFVGGGSEAIESALKIARQYHRLRGEPTRTKFITRRSAYHGTTSVRSRSTEPGAARAQFEPLLPGCFGAPMPYRYRCPYCADKGGCTLQCADEIDGIVQNEGPETVAAVILEPVQNSGGSITPPPGLLRPRPRDLRRERLLLVADEVICGFGRVGDWFGCTRYGIQPDMMTLAKGITSAYAPLGAVVASEKAIEPFFGEPQNMLTHGITFGGIRSRARSRSPTSTSSRARTSSSGCRARAGAARALRAADGRPPDGGRRARRRVLLPLELVKDKETKETFAPAERDELIKGLMTPRMRELGVYTRFDDRAETCAQFAPPFVAGLDEFDEMVAVLRQVLDEAWERINA